MDTSIKKISNFLRGALTYADYFVFKLLSKRSGSPRSVKRILVVERLLIGDLIVCTPVFRALREKFPDAKIDVLIQPSMVDVLSGNPNLSEIIPVSDDELKDRPKSVVQKIKDKYDLGVILNYGTYNISKILRDANIPYRIGATKAGLLTGRGFFLTRKTKPTLKIKHKVEHHMDVVRTIGVDTPDKHLEVFIPEEAKKCIREFKIKEKDFVVAIHPSPAHKTHLWFSDRFAQVADTLIEKYSAKIVFTGANKDNPVIEEIQNLMKNPSVSAAGKTTMKEYFALIVRANLLISVDTSAMHVGSAVGTPTIALFGAGRPDMWRPYGDRHIVIYKDKEACTGCWRHTCLFKNMECMRAITVDDVLKAVEDILCD